MVEKMNYYPNRIFLFQGSQSIFYTLIFSNYRTLMMNHIEKIACTDCKLSDICLPFGLQINEIKALESIVKNKRPLHSNQLLYSLD
jgi:hypothetical protein